MSAYPVATVVYGVKIPRRIATPTKLITIPHQHTTSSGDKFCPTCGAALFKEVTTEIDENDLLQVIDYQIDSNPDDIVIFGVPVASCSMDDPISEIPILLDTNLIALKLLERGFEHPKMFLVLDPY